MQHHGGPTKGTATVRKLYFYFRLVGLSVFVVVCLVVYFRLSAFSSFIWVCLHLVHARKFLKVPKLFDRLGLSNPTGYFPAS